MCGICGAIQITGTPREVLSDTALKTMTDAIAHRGPTDMGAFHDPGVSIGVRRLAIVDVEGGHQPFANEDGSVVAAQNGELYNHGKLRKDLSRSGHHLRSRCDTEVIPHIYEERGTSFPSALHGKFAIVVWDSKARRGILARDRLGVKPLYWARIDDTVVFASELKSLLASGLVRPEIDVEAVDLYMTLGYVPGPRTPLVGVCKLTPGSTLTIENGKVCEERYWAYPEPRPERGRSLDSCADELTALLREAIRDRLMSDVPLGAMLSGGLDSSLMVALMSEMVDGPVQTFSVGFREDPANELVDARRIASLFDCEHHELELSIHDDALSLDELVWHLDEPVADLSVLGFDALSRLAAEHVTVALAGQGADELFGGYPKHRAASALRGIQHLPAPARSLLRGAPISDGKISRIVRTAGAETHADRLLALSARITPRERANLYRGELAAVSSSRTREMLGTAGTALTTSDPLLGLLYLDAQLALVDHMLLYFDRSSMAHSLEVRVPYLDHRLVEWAARLPADVKVRRGVTKHVLKLAGERVLPPTTVRRRKVGFLRHALDRWLAAQLDGPVGERLTDPQPAFAGLFDPRAVAELVARFRHSRDEDSARLVLALLILESWFSTFLVRSTAPASTR